MSDSYYIRVRGEVKGPLSREQIVSQIRKKRLGRHHELSADAVTWERAGDIQGLFEPAISSQQPIIEPVAVQTPNSASTTESTKDSASANGWYYAKGRNNLGPVSADELRAMLATSRLLGTDRVWHETLEDWTPAQDLPQFMGSVADAGASSRRSERRSDGKQSVPRATFIEVVMGTSRGASLPDDAIYKYPNLTRYLLIAEGAARILFVVLLLAVVSGFIVIVGQQMQFRDLDIAETIAVVLVAGIALVLQSIMIWLLFISCLAALELVRILIKIEDNTAELSREHS